MTTVPKHLQLILTGFPLAERLHLTFGVGVRIAVTPFHRVPKGVEPHALVASALASEF